MQGADLLTHFAGALLVAALLVRNLRVMRLLALGAGVAAVAACILAEAHGAILLWSLVFAGVSAVQLVLAQLAQAGGLRSEERALVEDILRIDDPARQKRLVGLLKWRDAHAGEVLIRQGQAHPPLIYVASGTAAIELDGQPVGTCGAGDFLGDMSSASGERASTAVIVADPMRIATVDRSALARLATAAPEIGAAFDRAINRGLAAKIKRMNEGAATH